MDRDQDGKNNWRKSSHCVPQTSKRCTKQVWDLSDQDNDCMLSMREFCIVPYLMEKHRAGTPLPRVAFDSLRYDEVMLRATGLPSTAYKAPSWKQNQGLPHRGPY